METRNIDPKPEAPRETVLVKKGLIYYLFKTIGWVFKIIFLLIKFAIMNISDWIKELGIWRKESRRRKRINATFNLKNDEVI